uniref:Uncharacterized protein n=1 Tax=Solanum tuberosum TaxID=4113 RepID=M1DP08_SOLTU
MTLFTNDLIVHMTLHGPSRSDHGPFWWSVVHHCNPSLNQLRKLAKSRLTDRPTVRRSDHGPWSVSVDRNFPYPASETNYGRPTQTVIRSMVHRKLESREEKKVKNPSSRTQQGSISSSPEIERFLRGIRHQVQVLSIQITLRSIPDLQFSSISDCAAEDCLATLVEIADELGDPPFGQLIAFNVLPLASSHSGSLGGTVLLRKTDR